MTIQAAFDTDYLTEESARQLLERFEGYLHQLATATSTQRLREIDSLSKSDYDKIWSWNAKVPEPVDKTLHSLFEQQAALRPEAPAVSAWDGELSFGELNSLATRLAARLVSLGVGPEVIVPTCFEKSRWNTVAMLAVLKAGGAFAPLDPAQAADRRDRVLQQTGARVIVASTKSASSLDAPGRIVIPLDLEYLEKLSLGGAQVMPAVPAKSAAYVIFTSGSTGQPKGVVVEHRAIAASCLSHGPVMGFNERSRVMQYSSYTFDVSIMETMTTLVHGGCICVPSAQSRDDNLAETIRGFRINIALLAPVVARLLDPLSVPGLETIVLGADTSSRPRLRTLARPCPYPPRLWSNRVRHLLLLAEVVSPKGSGSQIGTAVGSVAWIVNPDNSDLLAPPGTIGELLVEGPILARGYLHDEEKTAAAFIEDPPWLTRGSPGHPGRRGRLYKTGDLVRYSEDGSLVFVGRKDAQVKIRGQRVELGEVEYHMRACLPNAIQVVAEVITPSGDEPNPVLAVFIVRTDDQGEIKASEGSAGSDDVQVITLSPATEDALAERLPSSMIPTVVFALNSMPVIISGKADRKKLRVIGGSFTAQQIAEMKSDTTTHKKAPSTDAERGLQEILARVLNLDPASIGVDDSFFRLGGDSITAMQVSALARSTLGNISSADILRKKTISQLAPLLTSRPTDHSLSPDLAPVVQDELENRVYDLSPIQRLFFHLEPMPHRPFDQSFLLRVRSAMPLALFRLALETVVSRHPMLRARFIKDLTQNSWQQYISDDIAGSFNLHHAKGQEATEKLKASTIVQCRERLNIEKGPLLACTLFEDGPGQQSFFICVHHLVVDLFSWRIILRDLEELLTTGTVSAPPSMNFPAWCKMQADHTAKHLLQKADKQTADIQQPLYSYWGLEKNNIIGSTTATKTFTLNRAVTDALFGSCNTTFKTRPVELLVAALAYSFGLAFPGRSTPPIYSEGHSRETWDDEIDISQTIGWFTTIFPASSSDVAGLDLVQAIRVVKDSWREHSR